MFEALIVTAAAVPGLALMWLFHASDRFPEPQDVLWKTFFLGIGSVGALVIIHRFIPDLRSALPDPLSKAFYTAFFKAAIPEELVKFAVLVLYCYRHREFNEPMDGIVYGAVASLGFATMENIQYVMEGGGTALLLRAFSAVPSHAFGGAIMGYFVGQAWRWPRRRKAMFAAALGIPVLLHGLYDLPLMASKYAQQQYAGDIPVTYQFLLPVTLAVILIEATLVVIFVLRMRRAQALGIALQQQTAQEVESLPGEPGLTGDRP